MEKDDAEKPRERFKWGMIIDDSIALLLESFKKKTPINSASQLYEQLEKKHTSEEKPYKLPTPGAFRMKLRKLLGLKTKEKNEPLTKTSLYALIGKFQNMSISALAKYATVTEISGCWLLLKVSEAEPNRHKILYYLSSRLKDRYANKVVFVASDDDTIVCLCKNRKALEFVKKDFSTFLHESEG